MKRAALLALLVVAGCAAPLPEADRYIWDDPGGNLVQREREVAITALRGERVAIMGNCASACLMFLTLPNVCVSPNATLGMHSIIHSETREIANTPESIRGRLFYATRLPPGLAEYWWEHYGGRPREGHTKMSGAEFISRGWAKECA